MNVFTKNIKIQELPFFINWLEKSYGKKVVEASSPNYVNGTREEKYWSVTKKEVAVLYSKKKVSTLDDGTIHEEIEPVFYGNELASLFLTIYRMTFLFQASANHMATYHKFMLDNMIFDHINHKIKTGAIPKELDKEVLDFAQEQVDIFSKHSQ